MSAASANSKARYILRFTGVASSSADLERLGCAPGVTVLDRSDAKMVLVEGSESAVRAAVQDAPGWLVLPDRFYRTPDPRAKALHKPKKR